jgi:hypothetical protein
MVPVDHVPVASLTLPITVLVRVPIDIVVIMIRVHRGTVCRVHHGPAVTVHDGLGVRVCERKHRAE